MIPTFRRQLDGTRYEGANCGPVATGHAMGWSTRGKLQPKPAAIRGSMDGHWVGQQERPASDATNLADNERAWESYRDDAKRKGLVLAEFDDRVAKPWENVAKALGFGKGVMLQIDYRTVNDIAPRLSGDRNFDGLHVVFIPKKRERDGRTDYLVYDGLADGRRAGIPNGPQWWPAWVLQKAAEDRVRRNIPGARDVATFAVIARSEPPPPPPPDPDPEPEPEPEPTPEPTLEEQLAKAQADLAELTTVYEITVAQLAVSSERVDDLEEALAGARNALNAARGGIEAAIADVDALLPVSPDTGAEPTAGVGDEVVA